MTSIGLIGAGMIANIHAEAAKRIGTSIAVVYDPREERAQEFASKHSCDAVSSVEALLAREEIDGVVIAVPNDRHAELAIVALNAGKHVLLEKPMAMSLIQCDEILSARNASGKVLQMGFVCRYSPAAVKIKEIIESGLIGEVLHIQATLLRQRGIPGMGGWFTTKARSGGGCLIDIGVHLIDLVMHITSKKKPVRVSGKCTSAFTEATYAYEEMWSTPVRNGTFDVEDRVRALLSDASGTTFQFDISWATHLPENTIKDGLLIEGTLGSLVVDLWANELTRGFSENGNPKSEIISVELNDAWDDAFDSEHRAFAQAIETEQLEVGAGSGEDGKLVQSIVDAIYASDELGREVNIEQ